MSEQMNIPVEQVSTPSKQSAWKKFWFYDYAVIPNNFKFILFIFSLMVIYIYNGQVYERKVREITKKIAELKDIEYEYRHYNKEWILRTKQSEIEKKLADKKIFTPNTSPFLIKK